MKYGDLILICVTVIFLLTLAFTVGVKMDYWFLPAGSFVLLIFFYYEFKIK